MTEPNEAARISCSLVEDLLQAYLDGETSLETTRLLKEHLRLCADCQAKLSALEWAREDLQGLAPRRPAPESPDALIVAHARRRFRRWLLKTAAVVLAAAVAVSALGWLLTSPLNTGLYLPRLEFSQTVFVAGGNGHGLGLTLPIVWVPAWPGQKPPEPREAIIEFADGTQLRMNVTAFDYGGSFWYPRYRQGNLSLTLGRTHTYERGDHGSLLYFDDPNDGAPLWEPGSRPYVAKSATSLVLLDERDRVIASTHELRLQVVQVNGEQVTWDASLAAKVTPVFDSSGYEPDHALLLMLSEAVTLEDILLPPEAYPLELEIDGKRQPLTLPCELPAGEVHIICRTGSVSFPGWANVSPLIGARTENGVGFCCPSNSGFYFPWGEPDDLGSFDPESNTLWRLPGG